VKHTAETKFPFTFEDENGLEYQVERISTCQFNKGQGYKQRELALSIVRPNGRKVTAKLVRVPLRLDEQEEQDQDRDRGPGAGVVVDESDDPKGVIVFWEDMTRSLLAFGFTKGLQTPSWWGKIKAMEGMVPFRVPGRTGLLYVL
jgi:hypothetical protein